MEQLAIEVFANALETIPTTFAENTGQDPIDMLVNLSVAYEKRVGLWNRMNIITGKIMGMIKDSILEPMNVK